MTEQGIEKSKVLRVGRSMGGRPFIVSLNIEFDIGVYSYSRANGEASAQEALT